MGGKENCENNREFLERTQNCGKDKELREKQKSE